MKIITSLNKVSFIVCIQAWAELKFLSKFFRPAVGITTIFQVDPVMTQSTHSFLHFLLVV